MSETIEQIRLTQLSKGAGCGCKIAPDTLQEILGGAIDKFSDANLLVGNDKRDDAAVYDLGNGQALISTTDFFSPIVDDPFDFGRIAATNAISDIYAMGGKPILALGILGWPLDKVPASVAQEVMRGGTHVCNQLGIALAGGHSIDVPEPIFGLAVNGLANLDRVKKNASAQVGDLLYLTKPLGIGILSTAMKRGVLATEHQNIAIDIMCESNSVGAELSSIEGVHAMTDVTGFGLLGHLQEMCLGANLTCVLERDAIPVIPEAVSYLGKGCYPDGTFRNWRSYGNTVAGCSGNDMLLFSDPQTSGGLLVAADPDSKNEVETILREADIPINLIGKLTELNTTEHMIALG